jgi:hypothetical protein
MAKAKSNKKVINERILQIREICEQTKFCGVNQIDTLREIIENELKPSYLKVVSNDEDSIRIHAKWNDPGIIVNMIY